jgi:carnitine-CoA ligase
MVEELIRARESAHPNEVWLKFEDETYTWREVLSSIQRAANGLLEAGVRPGERVGIMMRNRPEFLWVHFGIGFIGAWSVPVNTSQRGETLRYILADSDTVAVVFDSELREAVAAVRDDVPDLRIGVAADGSAKDKGVDRSLDQLMDAPDEEPDVEVEDPTGAVGMMYTSGTTGPPKGVVATKYDTSPLQTILGASGVQAGDTMYTGLPLYHGNALLVSAVGSMFLDAKLALAERFSPSRLLDDCRKHNAIEFNTLGGMINMILKQPPRPDDRDHPVRVVLSAGCPPDAWEAFEDRFGIRIIEWFGMVDAPGFLLNADGKVGSMGKPVGDLEFRVIDDNEQPLAPDQIGELVFRHPAGQLTYYHKLPDKTEEAWRGGWFHTGDRAEYDEEGYFYYRGRKMESMRRRGENISAWEIESVLNQHPDVRESAAHAVPSEIGEDEVKVVVTLKPGAERSPEELLDFCQGKMAYYAVPRYVEFVDELPKTGTQRIQYGELKQRGITPQTWDREEAGYKVQRA